MLKLRLCPTCGAVINHNDLYFCHSCGARLPEPVEPKTVSNSITDLPKAPPIKSLKFSYKKAVFLGVFFLILLTAVFVFIRYFFLARDSESNNPGETCSVYYYPLTSKLLDIDQDDPLVHLTPETVTFYLRSADLDNLLLDSELVDKIELSSNFSLAELSSYLDGGLAIMEHPLGWGVVAKVKDIGFAQSLLKEFIQINLSKIEYAWDGTYLFVTNSPELKDVWSAVVRGTSKNLNMSPHFSNAFRQVSTKLNTHLWFYWSGRQTDYFSQYIKMSERIGISWVADVFGKQPLLCYLELSQ